LLFSVYQPQLDEEANGIELVTWQRELKARMRNHLVLEATAPFKLWLLVPGIDETAETLARLGNRLVFGIPPGAPPTMALRLPTGETSLIGKGTTHTMATASVDQMASAVAGMEVKILKKQTPEGPFGESATATLGQL
jgi:hypothetical protein